jgi:hypothetical protein
MPPTSTPPHEKLRIVRAVCERIAQGETVLNAAKAEGSARNTIISWCHDDGALMALYMRARSLSALAYDDEAMEVARSSTAETYAADKLLVDTLKWAAAKRRPDEYGDRSTVRHEGSVGHLHMEALQAPKVSAVARLAPGSEVPSEGGEEGAQVARLSHSDASDPPE